MANKTITGRTRDRKTRGSVRYADLAARWIIACGGIGTIIAVLLVCVFLVAVVVPLFWPASLSDRTDVSTSLAASAPPVRLSIDEYQLLGTALGRDGTLDVLRLDTGKSIERREFLKETPPSAAAFTTDGETAAFGFADGTVRIAHFGFQTTFPEDAEIPATLKGLKTGEIAEYESGIVVRTPEGQLRLQQAVAELDEPIDLELKSPIQLIDYTQTSSGPIYCVLTEDGKLRLESVSERENLLTGEVVRTISHATLPYSVPKGKGAPQHLLLSVRETRSISLGKMASCCGSTREILRVPSWPKTWIWCPSQTAS